VLVVVIVQKLIYAAVKWTCTPF